MEGVRVSLSGDSAVAIVESISEAFALNLRSRLTEFCYGASKVSAAVADEIEENDPDNAYYSFNQTIREFLLRYDPKPDETKIGMAGELLVHALMPHMYPHLTTSAVFFNKEERSIKKGFDVTYYEATNDSVWYGEAKSGKVRSDKTATQKASSLLGKAASDVAEKLTTDTQESRWESALTDAMLTLQDPQGRKASSLLRSDAKAIRAQNKFDKRVVLTATVFHALDHCQVDAPAMAAKAARIRRKKDFTDMICVIFQQHEVETLVSHLREIAAS
jgi:hypothetical protein